MEPTLLCEGESRPIMLSGTWVWGGRLDVRLAIMLAKGSRTQEKAVLPDNILSRHSSYCIKADFADSAATPGSSLPSSSSKLAPPPVETWEKR